MHIRRLVAAAVAAAACAAPAAGQTVPVRSGEHDTFSRLVFPDQAGRDWSIMRGERTVEIAFSDGVPDLALDAVFDLIPKDRLGDISFSANTLKLFLVCDCPVEVQQIPSGHIVIDIEDGTIIRATPAPDRMAMSVGLETKPLLFPILASLGTRRQDADAQPTIDNATSNVAASQLRRHPMGRVPLVPSAEEISVAATETATCSIDSLARDILASDPGDALATLIALRGQVLTGEDTLDPAIVEDMARTYLRLGWGAEAAALLRVVPNGDADIVLVANALDGMPPPSGSQVDAGCGPGAAVIALLSNVDDSQWRRADETELIRLIDELPDQRWHDLGNRITEALARLDREELLIGLRPQAMPDPETPDQQTVAAGTDAEAVVASIELLAAANADGVSPPLLHLENARALRPSIPASATRDALDRELLEALIISRMPGPVIEMVRDGQAEAGTVIALVSDHLPAEDGVDFIVRLEPYLKPQDPARLVARDALMTLGLPETARRFAALPTDILPVEEPEPLTRLEPWLARDFQGLAAVAEDEKTPRNLVAEAVIRRNGERAPQADLANADRALARSAEMAGLIRQLLDAP